MQDFKPDKKSVFRAEQISSRIVRDLRMVSEEEASSNVRRNIFSEKQYSEEAEGDPIHDVVGNVAQMAQEFSIARRWGGKIPCLKLHDGSLAPISMTEIFGGFFSPGYDFDEWAYDLDEYLFPMHFHWARRRFLRYCKQKENILVSDFSEAMEGIQRNLTGFLSYRFAGFKRWRTWFQGVGEHFLGDPPAPPAVSPGGGLQVQVSCITPGLRIHISPAYFINWVFFGNPTTPVTSYVLPGRYVFSADGPMLTTRTQDNGVFCIPPSYHPALTKF